MKVFSRSGIIISIIFIIVILFSWRCLQLCGVIRCIPKEALELYEECVHGDRPIGLADLHLKCLFCRKPVKGIYYGIADRRLVEYDKDGNLLWEWRGCTSDGTCWQCIKCGKRFDKHGKSIWR